MDRTPTGRTGYYRPLPREISLVDFLGGLPDHIPGIGIAFENGSCKGFELARTDMWWHHRNGRIGVNI
ncbi:MAG: hypothetical protein ACXVMS_05500 [Flavisolibacter sp.]